MSEVVQQTRMPDGTEYRARLVQDNDADAPEDDGAWPILRLETHSALFFHGYVATAYNQAATPYVEKFNELAQRGVHGSNFERYLRIFCGGTQFHRYGPGNGTDYTYMAFDTKAWHEEMGFLPNNVEDLAREKPLAEIVAWIEGDVWGVVTETRWNPDQDKDEDDWEPLESVWGFYGREYAEKRATEELEAVVQAHKVVHRYTEHEKLSAHETEVGVILEFLEAPGKNLSLAKWHNGSDTATGRSAWYPVSDSTHQRIVHEFFGIDHDKIKQERDLMVKRLQEEASKS